MKYENNTGHPHTLNKEIRDRLIKATPLALRPGTIAGLARVHPNNFRRWLKLGSEDHEAGKWSEHSQLWCDYNFAKSKKIVEWLKNVEKRLPNWQALWELIRTVGREDFGVEAVEYKELLDLYSKLSDAFKRFSENPLQGASHAAKMDSEGDKQE
jgi:hypothetical protein